MTVSARRRGGIAFLTAAGFAGVVGAQTPQVPAADAVGIGRAGAGIAFGRSLEAATLNPALLPTLQDKGSAYFSGGFELQAAQITLQSNQLTAETTDRNRFLAGFGLAWRLSDHAALGLKLDQPWERHGLLPDDAPGRFLGRGWDLGVHRLEAQIGAELPSTPGLSFGLGAGVTRVSFTGVNTIRALVPQDGTQPSGGANPVIGLAEQSLSEEGSVTRPSFTLGARWAINPRWTLAATFQSAVTGDLKPSGSLYGGASYYGTNGYPPVAPGVGAQGAAVLAASRVMAGDGAFKLPAKATLGVRSRVNNLFTWELDIRAVQGGFKMPAWASLDTPSGAAAAPGEVPATKSGVGFSAMGEVDLTRDFTLRGGIAFDPAYLDSAQANPVLGGQASAAFSLGASYKMWGGELSAGYAYRQARDIIVPAGADGNWNQGGYAPSGTPARIEGMGHLVSIGYKIAF